MNKKTTLINLKTRIMKRKTKDNSSTTSSTTAAPVNPVPTTPQPPVYESERYNGF